MKKPLKLIWIGTDLPEVTSGRTYTITGKFKADKAVNKFFYIFKNNNGDEDASISTLFASPKRK